MAAVWFRNVKNVLSLVEMESIFFIADHTVLWFRFANKTVLIKHQCFICCRKVFAQCQGLLSFLLWCPQQVNWSAGKKLGGHTADPNWPSKYCTPYSGMLSHKTEEGGSFFQCSLCLETNCWWEVVSDYLCITWCFSWVFPLHVLNCLSWLLPLFLSPIPLWTAVSEWLDRDLPVSWGQLSTRR